MNYRAVARQKAEKYGLDPDIFERQINQESGFDPGSHSPAGAIGIAQIMPATAQSWGVDPTDPVAALDAAAKHMATYVRQLGSYRNALIAYNAGPGAVGKPLPAETQNYIKVILGDHGDPGHLGHATRTTSRATSGGTSGMTVDTPQATSPYDIIRALSAHSEAQPSISDAYAGLEDNSQSNVAEDLQNLVSTIQRIKGTNNSTPAPDGAGATPSPVSSGAGAAGGGRLPGLKGLGSGLKELFYDPLGGWKNGQSIGAIGGHSDHVHVAAGPKTAVAIGKLAQSLGLHVGENPHFGGVSPVHVPNSYHYKGEADDISGSPSQMSSFTKRLLKMYRLGG